MAPPGHKRVGYVVKVGHGVKGLKEGDRVAGAAFASRNHHFCATGSNRMQKIVRIVAAVGNDARKVKRGK